MSEQSDRDGRRGTFERMGESAGATAGRAMEAGLEAAASAAGAAADAGAELAGDLFRSAADTLGGWWSGESARRAADRFDERTERRCREHFRSGGAEVAGKSARAAMRAQPREAEASGAAEVGESAASGSMHFEQARPGYRFGWVAAQNPDYQGRSFSDVEPELRSAWESDPDARRAGSWPDVRGYVGFGYRGNGD